MQNKNWNTLLKNEVAHSLKQCWKSPIEKTPKKSPKLACQEDVRRAVDELISVLFPQCFGREFVTPQEIKNIQVKRYESAILNLQDYIHRVFQYQCTAKKCKKCHNCTKQAQAAVQSFVRSVPKVQKLLSKDVLAAYEGDPAARSTTEVIMSYPCIYAIIIHRLAHLLYKLKVPMIPRMISEIAHSKTGIDIHPGAQIGEGFFIDHGTGVVIGETCVIGKNVKLYQGVTLGALSFEKDAQGRLIKGIKRHPNVEDNVIIYAGATILGGQTTIGKNSQIGGNVWLIHSVPPHSKVYNQQPKPLIK